MAKEIKEIPKDRIKVEREWETEVWEVEFEEFIQRVLNAIKGHRSISPSSLCRNLGNLSVLNRIEFSQEEIEKALKILLERGEIDWHIEKQSHPLPFENYSVVISEITFVVREKDLSKE